MKGGAERLPPILGSIAAAPEIQSSVGPSAGDQQRLLRNKPPSHDVYGPRNHKVSYFVDARLEENGISRPVERRQAHGECWFSRIFAPSHDPVVLLLAGTPRQYLLAEMASCSDWKSCRYCLGTPMTGSEAVRDTTIHDFLSSAKSRSLCKA